MPSSTAILKAKHMTICFSNIAASSVLKKHRISRKTHVLKHIALTETGQFHWIVCSHMKLTDQGAD